MKKLIWIVILLAMIGGGGYWYYITHTDKEPVVTTLPVSRGDIVDAVGATGTLQAVTTVTVGTQVSGIVQDLYADFNDVVKKDKVIARLEPSILQRRSTPPGELGTPKPTSKQKVAQRRSQLVAQRSSRPSADGLRPRDSRHDGRLTRS